MIPSYAPGGRGGLRVAGMVDEESRNPQVYQKPIPSDRLIGNGEVSVRQPLPKTSNPQPQAGSHTSPPWDQGLRSLRGTDRYQQTRRGSY